ncbi:MAG: glycosyltransferase family 4 protein [bacterium]|nr:glycosyltransferase family 4 protein [bacterium]
MRVARVLTRLNLGGPARQALACDPILAARGHTVRVFAGAPEAGEGDLFETFTERGIDVVRVPGLGRKIALGADLRAGRFLRKALREWRPDLVHTHASKAGTLGRRAAWSVGTADTRDVRTVHTFHGHVLEGYFPPAMSRGLALLEARLARRTDRVVAVSHATADDLVRLEVCGEEQLTVIPPGVDLAPLLAVDGRSGALRPLVGAGDDVFVVGVVGRLAPVKRPALAVEIFEMLEARYPALQVVFIGDGTERRALERRIEQGAPAVRERVHMVGARADMPAVLADLDAVLLTSTNEGLPVALIEAGAAARPVVATSVGGVAELVAHERTGFLGEGRDELAYGLAQLLDSPELARAMGHRARLRVEKRHSGEALADRLESLYQACLT